MSLRIKYSLHDVALPLMLDPFQFLGVVARRHMPQVAVAEVEHTSGAICHQRGFRLSNVLTASDRHIH